MRQSYPPDPTPEEVLDTLDVTTSRISIAWDALKRILIDVLPPVIELANTGYGGVGVRKKDGTIENLRLPVVRECTIAPQVLDGDFPKWAIASSHGLSPFVPGLSELQGNTVVFLAYNSMMSAADKKDSSDLMDKMIATLHPYLGGHTDAGGLECWNELVPSQRVFLQGIPGWENARGFAQHFNVVQFPGAPRWRPQPD